MNLRTLDLKPAARPASKTACRLLAGAAILALAGAGAASAQSVVSRTSDYTASWSSPTFSGYGVFDGGSIAYPGQTPFSNSVFNFAPAANATNLAFNSGGGISIAPQPPLTVSPIPILISGNGAPGYWGWTYTSNGPGGYLVAGSQGGRATLTFNVGGDMSGADYQGIYYYVNVFLPGNWTTPGTAAGDYQSNGVGAGFSTPTFTYNPTTKMTTVSTMTANYTSGEDVDLNFTLFGASVPEPATWTMMILGVAMVGYAARRRREGMAAA